MDRPYSEYAEQLRKAWDKAEAEARKACAVEKVIRRLPDGNTEVLDIVETYQTGAGVVVVVR